ncbi:MAG: DUF2380 domain-containing protein, partial [Planctomycetales bacterium]|nr:DUF2380 domain-containing protein [Planctomycetales bacterium]
AGKTPEEAIDRAEDILDSLVDQKRISRAEADKHIRDVFEELVDEGADPKTLRQVVEEALEEGVVREVSPRSAVVRAASDAQHHVFTKARRAWFKNRYGIDVDDFVVDVDDLTHQAVHAGKSALRNRAGWWDHELMTRIRDAEILLKRKLTRDEVLDIGNDLLKRFNIDQVPHPYVK